MESSSLASMGSLSAEISSFSLIGANSDMPANLIGVSSKEDSTVDEVGRVGELRGAGRLRITSFRPRSAQPI